MHFLKVLENQTNSWMQSDHFYLKDLYISISNVNPF